MNLNITIDDITEELLRKFISNDLASEEKQMMNIADKYLINQNTSISSRRKMMMLVDDRDNPYLKDDYSKANNKVKHNYLSELINQCTNFLAGRQLRIDYKKEVGEQIKQLIDDELYKNNNFVGFIQTNVNNVQLYGKTFMRIIKNEEEIKFITYDPKEIIMFYDDFDEPILAIRYFTKPEIVIENGKSVIKNIMYAEVYDKTYKDTWRASKKGKWEKIGSRELVYSNKVTYKNENDEVIKEEKEPLDTPVFPIIEWRFNDKCIPTIQDIKEFIDLQDINLSDLANNVEDIQEAIWILENYTGQNLKEFMEDLKVKKAIKVGSGGNVKTETIEIPVEARKELYDKCNKNIYKFGFGIDFSERENLGNTSGVALKWSYAPLEQKGNSIENNGQEALNNLFNILFMIMGVQYDSNDLEFHFIRTMIANEEEQTSTVMSASSQLSQKTVLENLPMVKDVEEEIKRIEEDTEYEPISNTDDGTGKEDKKKSIIGDEDTSNDDDNGDNKKEKARIK